MNNNRNNSCINQLPIILKANSLSFQHPDIYGVSFDTRTLKPGDMFFAIKAERDGHDYVNEAIKKGAACAIIDHPVEHPVNHAIEHENYNNNTSKYISKYIVVENTTNTFIEFARLKRAMFKGKIIAITGSVGKTTAKEQLALCLKNNDLQTYTSYKNFNNLLGLCYNLAQLPADADCAILELGIDHVGEMEQLAALAMPDYSLITNIAPMHLAKMLSLKNIAQEKGKIIKYTKNCVFLNSDLWCFPQLEAIALQNEVKIRAFKGDPIKGIKNGLKKIAEEIGMRNTTIIDVDIEGRNKLIQTQYNGFDIKVIDSTYNAGINSMIESINKIQNMQGDKILILGSMLGIGKHEQRYHEVLAKHIMQNSSEDLKNIALVGKEMQCMMPILKTAQYFENTNMLIEKLYDIINCNASILVKGSGEICLDKVIKLLQEPF